MKLKKLLLEITYDAALSALAIDAKSAKDAELLKQAFRKMSLLKHPDRGGSTQEMQTINAAYEFLKKYVGNVGSPSGVSRPTTDWDEIGRKYMELGLAVVKKLKTDFNPNAYLQHFNKIYNEVFNYKIENERPTENQKGSISTARYDIKFYNNDNSIVFDLDFSCYLHDVNKTTSLGGGMGNISYPLGVVAYGFFNNKKLKITQRDWQRTQNHDVLSNPELVYPKAKLEKFKTTSVTKAFKKADMILYLKNKLTTMKWDGTSVFYIRKRLDDQMQFQFSRYTFMGTGYWRSDFYINGKYRGGIHTLPETVETAKLFVEMENKINSMTKVSDIEQYVKRVSDEQK